MPTLSAMRTIKNIIRKFVAAAPIEKNGPTMVAEVSKRILFANDDKFFSAKISDLLTEAGHEVKCVIDGSEVIEELQESSDGIDLLILDLQIPEVDGYGVLEWMRDNNLIGWFPVLAVTGVYDPTHILKRLKNFEAVKLITKALSSEQVVNEVNRLLFPKMKARRKAWVPISIPADFTMGGTTLKGNILNLNEGGLFLQTTEELQTNADIQLTFTLLGNEMTMSANGLVQWYRCLSGEKRLFCGAGIRFLDLSQQEQTVIQHFVHRERKRLGLKRL